MKVKLDPGAIMPTRAHPNDAGLDLFAPKDLCVIIPKRGSAFIDTGVHVAIEEGYAGFIKGRSGLYRNFGITTDGTIDADYIGSIGVTLYNLRDDDYFIRAGDKIAQLVVVPIVTPEPEAVDELDDTERGSNGFGSTGK